MCVLNNYTSPSIIGGPRRFENSRLRLGHWEMHGISENIISSPPSSRPRPNNDNNNIPQQEYGHSLFFQRFLKQSDQTQSGDVGLAEFIHYVREHEKNLRLQFTHLDKNKDGKVDLDELILAFKELGVEIDNQEAAKLLKR